MYACPNANDPTYLCVLLHPLQTGGQAQEDQGGARGLLGAEQEAQAGAGGPQAAGRGPARRRGCVRTGCSSDGLTSSQTNPPTSPPQTNNTQTKQTDTERGAAEALAAQSQTIAELMAARDALQEKLEAASATARKLELERLSVRETLAELPAASVVRALFVCAPQSSAALTDRRNSPTHPPAHPKHNDDPGALPPDGRGRRVVRAAGGLGRGRGHAGGARHGAGGGGGRGGRARDGGPGAAAQGGGWVVDGLASCVALRECVGTYSSTIRYTPIIHLQVETLTAEKEGLKARVAELQAGAAGAVQAEGALQHKWGEATVRACSVCVPRCSPQGHWLTPCPTPTHHTPYRSR